MAAKTEQLPLLGYSMKPDKRFSEGVSLGLDIYKGIFVVFMLAEHSRAGIGIDKKASQAVWFVNNVAHSLDMICYSFAYGYSCYRSYLSDLVPRTPYERWSRWCRSSMVIWGAAVMVDMFFAWITSGRPSMETLFELAIGYQVYWDFLRTFPFMLFMMTLCIPVIDMAYGGLTRSVRLGAAASMILVPLAASYVTLPMDCKEGLARFVPFIVTCRNMSIRSSRFPALPQLVNFNLGVLVAMWIRRVESTWSVTPASSEAPRARSAMRDLSGVLLVTLSCSIGYAVKLLTYWKDHDMEELDVGEGLMHFSRWPPRLPWLLGCMGLGFGLFVVAVAVGVCLLDFRENYIIKMTIGYFEHLGANVLLYLVLSNILIQATGGFHGFAGQIFISLEVNKQNEATAPFIRCAAMLAFIGFIHYVVKGSRK